MLRQHIWYGDSLLRWVLWPISLSYRFINGLRRYGYRVGLLTVVSCHRPVIVVGNITVGGSGKTPFCIALCQLLKKHGYKPGLVSRGYGGKSAHWPQVVTARSDPRIVGDEPVLLVQRTQCPMVVAPDRVAAAQQLIAHYNCDVVVSDDGLQHYRLDRDIEIVLLDKKRGIGNGLCLPAGPLREPMSRLKSVDFIVSNQLTIEYKPIYSLLNPDRTITSRNVQGLSVCALAGIAHPNRFFEALSVAGFVFKKKIFDDHYAYKESDLLTISADIIIMTEKDAVKCQAFCDKRCYILPMVMVLSDVFSNELLQRIREC